MDKEVMMEQNKDVQKGTQTNSLGKKKKDSSTIRLQDYC